MVKDPDTYNKGTFELVGTKKAYTPAKIVAIYNEVSGDHAEATFIDINDFFEQIHLTDLYMRAGFTHLKDSYSKWGLDGNPYILRTLLGREPTSLADYMKRELNN